MDELKKAILHIEDMRDVGASRLKHEALGTDDHKAVYIGYDDLSALNFALEALREKLERESNPKPEPLTLERLREMDREPVWVVYKGDEYSEAQSHWCFVSGGDVYPCDWYTVNDYTYPLKGFGAADTDLCAYATKPETEGD